jgi:hypothetical protein
MINLLVALVGNLLSYLRTKLETKSVTRDTAFALIVKMHEDGHSPDQFKCICMKLANSIETINVHAYESARSRSGVRVNPKYKSVYAEPGLRSRGSAGVVQNSWAPHDRSDQINIKKAIRTTTTFLER